MAACLKKSLRCARSWSSLSPCVSSNAGNQAMQNAACIQNSRMYTSGETFSDPEIKFYYQQFIKYDKDKDGMLSRWELNELFREKYDRQLNSADLEKMLLAMGVKYCDNTVTFTQYMTLLQKRFAQRYCLQELIQLFDMWDKDSNGLIDWPEFRKAVGFIGYDPDHPELLCRFQKSDRDVDDMVDFDEFVEAIEGLPCLAKRCKN